MAWFKVDDKLWGHQKWVSAPPGARSLWVTAGSWAADHLTDGFIPTHMLGIFGARLGDSRKLVEIGLWEVAEGGWRFRDWADYQPSRESVMSEREKARQRQHEARERAKLRTMSRRDNGVTDAVTMPDVTDLSHDPDPTRPDPTHPEPTTHAPTVRGRATRIPDPFVISQSMRVWASTEAHGVDVERSTAKFVDYWRGKSGRDATKADWPATWRNWLRRDFEDHSPHTNGRASPSGRIATSDQRIADGLDVARRLAAQEDETNYPLEIEA